MTDTRWCEPDVKGSDVILLASHQKEKKKTTKKVKNRPHLTERTNWKVNKKVFDAWLAAAVNMFLSHETINGFTAAVFFKKPDPVKWKAEE